jgi:hypothetical protein
MCCAGCGWRAGELPSRQLAARFPQGGQHSICTPVLPRLAPTSISLTLTSTQNPRSDRVSGEQAFPPIELRLLLDLRGMKCHKSPPPSTIRDCSSIQMRMPSRGRSRHSERNVIHIFVKDLALLFHAKARMIFMKSSLLVSLEAILSCWSQPAQALQLGSFLAHCACHNAGRVLGDGRGSPTIRSCLLPSYSCYC